MFDILTDKNNISAVFKKYAVPQALQVKSNLDSVFKSLTIPSPELILQMEQEGIFLNDLEPTGERRKNNLGADFPGSVVRSNLFRMFLNDKELLVAMEGLTTSEKIDVRALLTSLESDLKLPSKALMEKMAKEGIDLPNTVKPAKKVPVKTPNVNLPKLTEIKTRLNSALAGDEQNGYVNNVTEFQHSTSQDNRLLAVKNKLNSLTMSFENREEKAKEKIEFEGSLVNNYLLKVNKK